MSKKYLWNYLFRTDSKFCTTSQASPPLEKKIIAKKKCSLSANIYIMHSFTKQGKRKQTSISNGNIAMILS